MHIYEYLFTGVIIVVMLGASIGMVSVLSQPTQDASEKELLKVTSDKIMTQVLIDPGYPYNWGSDGSDPTGFGLAKYGLTSREVYLLDPDKVQRLNPDIGDAYVEPKTALNCLNLGRDYGLTLQISPALNLEVKNTTTDNQAAYSIIITSATNALPVKNANITAALYNLNGEVIENKSIASATTDFIGNCTLNFDCDKTATDVLIVSADFAGQHLTKVMPLGANTLPAYIIGPTIATSQPYTLNPTTTTLTEVLVTQRHSTYVISNITADLADDSTLLVLEATPEASTVAVLAQAKNSEGQTVLIVGYRELDINYRSIAAIQSGSFSYSIERRATIAGTTCTVTLYLWRMAV